MIAYTDMTDEQLASELTYVRSEYDELKKLNLALDMSRGKPSPAQLDLSTEMLSILNSSDDCVDATGLDCRNYGVIDGIEEARELMASMLDDSPDTTIVLGNSSLSAMYDTIARCLDFGCLGSEPWGSLDDVKFICVVPGYDRHFTILEQFGIDMITVDILEDGPDMDEVERIVADDASVKGIWCVPKYSNPSGVTYSDEVVKRLASMNCAADDFRIFWDNAYCVHDLYTSPNEQDHLLDIGATCREAGNPNRYFKFGSTSKVTFPGAGICAISSSKDNIAETKRLLGAQMIGADKLNQLRHVRFLPNIEAVHIHMAKQADIIRPKFELVEKKLEEGLEGLDIAEWTYPRGGYFISFDGLKDTAKRTVELAAEAGVKLTNAGATYPYGIDPIDSNIRIAPTMPTLKELSRALDVFICCVKIAALETLV